MDVNSVPQSRLKRGTYRTVFVILLRFFWENYGDVAMKFFPNFLEPSIHRLLPKDILSSQMNTHTKEYFQVDL